MSQDPVKIRLKAFMTLHRAWRLAWRAAPRWTLVNLLVMLAQACLPLLALVLLKQIVDSLGVALANPSEGSFLHVSLWIGLAGLVALLTAIVNALGGHAAEAQGLAVTDHVTDVIHDKSIAVDLGYYEDPSFHDTLHLTQQEAPFRPARIVNGLKQTLLNSLILCGIVGLLFTFHWLVGLALVLAALPAGVVRLIYARQLFGFEQGRSKLERKAWYYHWMMTSAEYARDIRLFGVGSLFGDRFRDLQTQLREGRLDISAQRTRRDMLAQGVAIVALYCTLAGMAFYSVQGGMTLGVIVMYFQGYQRALTALQNILQGLAWLYEDNLFLKHFYAFLDLPVEVEGKTGETIVPEASGEGLVCRNIHFTYPSRDVPVLNGIDFIIRPGEVVALVGLNGAGKTTLAKLLCRLYDPQQGIVSWEGEDLKTFNAQAWRKQVSAVCQDFSRFDLSIAENIWLGDVERPCDNDLLLDAARIAGSEEIITHFPDGLQTLLGTQYEKGQELSVGEWQRIALSRAYFRKARLLILDEPSSSLDPLAEAEMIKSFRAVIGKRSALIISHRLSTVQLADRIYVLDHGLIVEQGTHQELLQRNGHYARLYSSQAGHYKNSEEFSAL